MKVPRLRAAEPGLTPAGVHKRFEIPYLSCALLVVLAAVFGCELIFAVDAPKKALQPSISTLVALGGLSRDLVIQHGEWYRLLSAIFLHADLAHLLFNAVALIFAGMMLEHLIGRAWFATSYFAGGLIGSVFSLVVNPPTVVGIGASGAIMGLFATIWLCSYLHLPGAERTWLQTNSLRVLIPSLLPLIATTTSGDRVDYGAHLGGVLGGALVGLVILRTWPRPVAEFWFRSIASTLSVAGLILALATVILIKQNYGAISALIPSDQYPKDTADGKKRSEALVAAYPRDPRTYLYRSLALVDAQDFGGAVRELRIGLAQREELRLLPNEFEDALKALLASAIYTRGMDYLRKGAIDRAITDFDEVIEINVPNLKLDQKSLQGAAREIRPFHGRGLAYMDKQDYVRALADFNEAIRRNPEDVHAISVRGRIRFLTGDYSGAIPDLRRFAESGPPTGHEPFAYGMLWLYMAQSRVNRAGTSELTIGAARLKDQTWPYAVIELFLGNRSVQAMTAVATNTNERCEANFYAAEWYLLRDERDAAAELLKSAAEICPKTFIEYTGAIAELKRLK